MVYSFLAFSSICSTPIGGYFNLSEFGVSIEVSPDSTQDTNITCKIRSEDSILSPCGDSETLVSYIVELCGPTSCEDLRRPVIVTIMHSGPGQQQGYETVVKAYNDKRQHMPSWEEVEGSCYNTR